VHLSYGSLGDDLLAQHPQLASRFLRHRLNEIIEGPHRRIIHNEDQYLTDYFAARAAEFIERRSRAERPYFLYVPFNAVHSPHMVIEKYYSRFPNIHDHQLRVYAAMIASLDDAVGRIMAAVDASGATRDTLIYFASDNGCEMYFPGLCSCSPLRGGKLSDYEGGTRVPFILSWPSRLPAGAVYPAPVSLLDVLPTSLAAAGRHLPAYRTFDGVDLLPHLTGKITGIPHDELFWRRQPLFAIRKGDWKLWESNDASGIYGRYKLLFNLKDDPNETTNLAASHPEKVRELEASLHEWSADMAAPKWTSRPPDTFEVCGKRFTLPI
jgi:arylsulfatase A-like enzyme